MAGGWRPAIFEKAKMKLSIYLQPPGDVAGGEGVGGAVKFPFSES
jgi:hypothetical protein